MDLSCRSRAVLPFRHVLTAAPAPEGRRGAPGRTIRGFRLRSEGIGGGRALTDVETIAAGAPASGATMPRPASGMPRA